MPYPVKSRIDLVLHKEHVFTLNTPRPTLNREIVWVGVISMAWRCSLSAPQFSSVQYQQQLLFPRSMLGTDRLSQCHSILMHSWHHWFYYWLKWEIPHDTALPAQGCVLSLRHCFKTLCALPCSLGDLPRSQTKSMICKDHSLQKDHGMLF